ncbi:MAG: hypothetical protein Q9M92_10800 [Enterobacterales bacterium]|nr:hypothetical protein [Enterobacterales bacterium]
MNRFILALTLLYTSSILAKTCELDTTPVEQTEYSLYNPFTACLGDLKIPGLPEIRKPGWKAKLNMDKILGKVSQVVCESMYKAVGDEFKDAFKDVIEKAIGKDNKIDIQDVKTYCKKHPDICLAGNKSAPNSNQVSKQQAALPQGLPNSNANRPSWGGWGDSKKPQISQQPASQKALNCAKKPWLCSKPSDSQQKSDKEQNKIDYDEKYPVTKKRY